MGLLKLPPDPGFRHGPFAFDGGHREVGNLGGFLQRQTAEVAQFHHAALERVEFFQLVERLDAWRARSRPSLRDRLTVFLSLCAAVEYAHRSLVIHRDLKPANILITPLRSPKLLDFGIAKALDPSDAAGATLTGGGRLLTPEYASPEQIRGERATTATDVYSLGAVLYWLLADCSPYEASGGDPMALLRAVCEVDPPPPSTVAAVPWARQLRGELDAIVLQCLRKAPQERYASVRELADDIVRWIDDLPVRAHPPSWWRRAAKCVRRNRIQTAAAGLVVCSILAGTAVSLWYARVAWREQQRAEARFNQVRRIARSVVFELHDAIEPLPGSTQARRILVERALQYLQDLETTGAPNRELKLEIAAAYVRVGDVQGNLGRAHLGNTQAAVESATRARRLAQEVLREHPTDLAAEQVLADSAERLARLGIWQGDYRRVDELYREVSEIRRRQAARQPADKGFAAESLMVDAHRLAAARDWKASLPAIRKAVAAYREALAPRPQDEQLTAKLAKAYGDLAHCWQELGDLPAALQSYREAQRLDESRVAAAPGALKPQIALSFDLVDAGWIEYSLGRFEKAIDDYEQSLAIQERLAAADPQDVWMKVEAAKLLNTAAPAYEAAGRRGKAIQILETAAARLETAVEHDPANEDTRLHVAWVWANLGDLYRRAGRPPEAASSYGRALEALNSLRSAGRLDFGLRPDDLRARANQGLTLCGQALSKSTSQAQ
jgi:tetratricopeptide (TPR) repeat protein